MKRVLAVLCCCISVQASAAVLDFEGLAPGASIGEAYAQYGVHFSGGVIKTNQLGAYVYGPTTVTFDTPVNQIRFMADGMGPDSFSRVCYEMGCEPKMFESMSYNPTTGTGKNLNWYEGQTWDTTWSLPGLTSITFNTIALDNLRFELPQVATGGTVPEPATLALLGLGAIGMLRRRQST